MPVAAAPGFSVNFFWHGSQIIDWVIRACLKFILIWKSIVCGSEEKIIRAFSELNKLIILKSGW